MKKPILILLFLVFAKFISAQQPVDTVTEKALDAVDPAVIAKKAKAENNGSGTYMAVEIQPEFAGPGTLFQFISNNLHYPVNAAKNHIQGKVIVQFVVEITGEVNNVTVLRSVSPDLDEEPVRVIKFTTWHPGIQNGRKVRVRFALPITFSIATPPASNTTALNPSNNSSDADLLGQTGSGAKPENSYIDNQIFTAVENKPNYPGGWDKLNDYINLYLKQVHNQYEGNVVMQFVVEKDGTLSNLKILRGINPDADALAVTIMKNCTKFNPGMQNGHVVRCYYTIAMKFTVQPSE
jgi:TonB family protein